MDASSLLIYSPLPCAHTSSSSSSKPKIPFNSSSFTCYPFGKCLRWNFLPPTATVILSSPQASLFRTSPLAVDEILEKSTPEDSVSPLATDLMPKIYKSGRFCSPRAARDLVLDRNLVAKVLSNTERGFYNQNSHFFNYGVRFTIDSNLMTKKVRF
ncbi:hypothetical protein L1987_42105 [Smallanthus sonchifolius]|uniref:Uncharacterized protein n=1 Tax=Smallanthus sonchifolius TaxID=185202 RepID=A0ACB9GVA8_9ASTR|nr:hypothetical protein L1987_42105 [Smallanthus sonchifolius]